MTAPARGISRLAFSICLGAGLVSGGAAQAEVFFRPFGGVFYGRVEEEPPPAFTSRQSVARIVAREGFRLVGPLGHYGEQIVANGVDRRGRRMRFFIDPYEGRVLNAQRIYDLPLPVEAEPGAEPPDMPYSGPRSELAPPPGRESPLPAEEPARMRRTPDPDPSGIVEPARPRPNLAARAEPDEAETLTAAGSPAGRFSRGGSSRRAIVPPRSASPATVAQPRDDEPPRPAEPTQTQKTPGAGG